MPYLHISTTKRLTGEERLALKSCALNAAALLGKRRPQVMVLIEDGLDLSRGDDEGNCAFCDVRVMGVASPEACNQFSQTLSADIARIAQTAPMSVYLNLSELTLCYTDGCLPPGH